MRRVQHTRSLPTTRALVEKICTKSYMLIYTSLRSDLPEEKSAAGDLSGREHSPTENLQIAHPSILTSIHSRFKHIHYRTLARSRTYTQRLHASRLFTNDVDTLRSIPYTARLCTTAYLVRLAPSRSFENNVDTLRPNSYIARLPTTVLWHPRTTLQDFS